MTVWCLGSINIDHFYTLPHLPQPGETLAAADYRTGLGGKGANQSVAAAKAGSRVVHIGAVGAEGVWARDRMAGYGVDISAVRVDAGPSGLAIINVDAAGENAIVTFAGANRTHRLAEVAAALARAVPGDLLLMQNETNLQAEAAELGKARGLRVLYSAAPFAAEAVRAVLGSASVLVMNRGEAEELERALGRKLAELPVDGVLVTLGGAGAVFHDIAAGRTVEMPAFRVAVADTTGAGDTFAGYFAAGLDQGMDTAAALRLASAAAAVKVTRAGTADAIPDRAEVDGFLEAR